MLLSQGTRRESHRTSVRRDNRSSRRSVAEALMQALEARMLMDGNLVVLGGPFLQNVIAAGTTTTSFNLYTDLGTTDINNTFPTRDFYVFNGGGSSTLHLTGNPVISIGGDPTDFSITHQPTVTSFTPTDSGSAPDAGNYDLFTVQFNPQTAGLHQAVVNILSDDPAHPLYQFTVSGTAVAPVTVNGGTEVLAKQAGAGPGIQNNDIITVNYTGYLVNTAPQDATNPNAQPGIVVFDSSLNTGRTPFIVQIGTGSVIPGWDNGFIGMQVGETATFIIPPSQAYGSQANGSIPANSTLIFDVSVLQLISPNFITKLYHDILGRAADQTGNDSWINQLVNGTTPAQVTASFLNSTEYRTNRIDALYQTVFGRAADADGLNAWLSYLAAGNTIEQMESQFYGSTEFYNANGATTDSVIDAMYVTFLSRHADPQGLEIWSAQINSGTSWSALALQLIQSNEGGQDTVMRLYQQYLGRGADANGLSYWSSLLANGSSESDVVAGFLSSQEYFSS